DWTHGYDDGRPSFISKLEKDLADYYLICNCEIYDYNFFTIFRIYQSMKKEKYLNEKQVHTPVLAWKVTEKAVNTALKAQKDIER
ncbi:MAG: hypothetical protein ACOCSL_05495, partial [Thermoplasmatota archaeon]